MEYDYLIVGAGSAGATLAARLSAAPQVQVALLEAGPDWRSAAAPPAMRSPNPSRIINDARFAQFRYDDLQAQRTSGQAPRTYWRGRGLGGSSTINGQIAIRATLADFASWVDAGCTGWSYDEVLPYYNALETDLRYGAADYHGDAGPIPIYRAPFTHWGPGDLALAESALDAGFTWAPDHNAPAALGVSPYAINSRDGARVSTNDAYLDAHRGRNNLTIVCNTGVDHLLFDGVERVTGVRCIDGRHYFGGCVILAAGAVHSPTILLRSGLGPAGHLQELDIPVRADLPVGIGLQDHPMAALPLLLTEAATTAPDFRHTNCCVRYSSTTGGAPPGDMMLVAMNRLGDGLGRNSRAPTPNYGLLGVWLNQCVSRGKLELTSVDPSRQPRLEHNMLSDPADLDRLRAGVCQLLELARHPVFAAITTQIVINAAGDGVAALTSDASIDAWLLATAGDTQHATSTCRMGDPGAATTVVDPACQVLGTRGLRVIDASVLPSVPCANTHLTTVMVAEKMAAELAASPAQ